MGRCGATELRGVTAGTTSPAANRLAVRVTAVTPMPVTVPVPATVLVPAIVLVTVQATVLVTPTVLVTILVTDLARGGRGAFRTMHRATETVTKGRLVSSAAFLSATQRV
jgi:hypothetical protein